MSIVLRSSGLVSKYNCSSNRFAYFNNCTRNYDLLARQRNAAQTITPKFLSTDAATKKIVLNGNVADSKDSSGTSNKNDLLVERLRKIFANDQKSGGIVPVHKKALLYGNKVAVKDEVGEFSYVQLYEGARKLASQLDDICGNGSNSKIAFLCSNTAVFTLIQWACWFSGQIAVPLSSRHPTNILDYYIKDSDAKVLISIPEFEQLLRPLCDTNKRPLLTVDHSYLSGAISLDESLQRSICTKQLPSSFYANSNAMILYTSGSTGAPKGTVLSHRNLNAQIDSLSEAWQYSDKDSLLHVLPLNHVHGVINALLVPLSVGGRVAMLPKFDSSSVWSALLNVNQPTKDRINLFMAVPTIYSLLIAEYDKVFSKNDRMIDYVRATCEKNIRLMISGSAPLPKTVYKRWHEITGHQLLERYGMTEIGMAISNPLTVDKVRQRKAGSIGHPLPGVECKLVKDGRTVVEVKGEANKGFWAKDISDLPQYEQTSPSKPTTDVELTGELYIRGDSVFKEYLNKPEETKKSFENGWFITGDEARFDPADKTFSILGRLSVDIIKSGGYKISALEIETKLLEQPHVSDVCVLGVPDLVWGQKIVALIVYKEGVDEDVAALKKWCTENLAQYQIPTTFKFVKQLPRNAMSKVNKKEILKTYFGDETKKESGGAA